MAYSDVVTLKADTPAAHGVLDAPASQTSTVVFVDVMSVTRTEAYAALAAGLNPDLVFRVIRRQDYDGQKRLEYRGVTYRVIRAYERGDHVDLTVERVNASE